MPRDEQSEHDLPVDNLDDSRGGGSLTLEFEESTAETPSPGALVVEGAATRVEGDANCDPSGGRFSFNSKAGTPSPQHMREDSCCSNGVGFVPADKVGVVDVGDEDRKSWPRSGRQAPIDGQRLE